LPTRKCLPRNRLFFVAYVYPEFYEIPPPRIDERKQCSRTVAEARTFHGNGFRSDRTLNGIHEEGFTPTRGPLSVVDNADFNVRTFTTVL
jgi:hypothetical protein